MKLDVLAIGAHPDDVELGCAGTLAVLLRRGYRVGILHLTVGESGTRGNPGRRRREAKAAAEILGVHDLSFLDCGDGRFRLGEEEEDALIRHLRRLRPELVLGPAPHDRHPDHGRAHRLVEATCYYSGLLRRGEGEPYRPGASFSYMQHDLFTPSFIVDVSSTWEIKWRCLAAYASQFHRPEDSDSEPATKVSSPEFALAVEGRARHYGQLIGAAFGEPFWSHGPPAVVDPMALVPGGIR